MKLSEAIRLGAMVGPQVTDGRTYDGDGSCALGAAMIATGHRGECYALVLDYFTLSQSLVEQPVTREQMMALSAVRELNDRHRWTREQIADWVDTIERAQEQTVGVRELQEQPVEHAQATTAA